MDMKLFSSQQNTDRLMRLFKQSRVGFNFDKTGVKNRLLSSIEEHQLSLATRRVKEFNRRPFLSRHRLATALGTAILVAAGSGAALSRADISTPGDKLHSFDQFQEELLLKLPLSRAQKASIHAGMVEERNRELNQILGVEDQNNVKAQAVQESQILLNRAVDETRTAKEDSVRRGKKNDEQKFDDVLNRLESLAAEQEQRVTDLRNIEKNELVQKELDNQLDSIKKARARAKLEPASDTDKQK
jgi:hypothetical protein